MQLKRVTVCGFKSFADKVDFEFGPGVTCIVGPNGCGKSNVVDAFKWVLGEQSARSLRGRQMGDMIFNGSTTRRSSSVAQVDLQFDNADRAIPFDHPEVTVSRKLYRSGESEYLVNGSVARLKDIREMFMDTGIGVDAYSVIEQGRVDQLLQSSPVERRIIFEEAAGISRYKARKKEAERKLERTNQNLLRVADVIEELEKRLRSVKLQAGKARNYMEYQGRLNELRSSFALSEYHRFTIELTRLGKESQERSDEVTALRTQIDQAEAEESQVSLQLDRLSQEIGQADNQLVQLKANIGVQEQRIESARRRIDEQRVLQTRIAERLETDHVRLGENRGELETVQQSAQQLQEQTHTFHARIDELNAQDAEMARNLTQAQAILEDEKTGIIDLLRRSAQTHNEIVRLNTHRESLIGQKGRLSQRDAQIRVELESSLERKAQFERRMLEVEALLAEETRRLEEKKAEAARTNAVRQGLVDELARDKERRSALQSRRDLLADLQHKMDGVRAGVRQVLDAAKAEQAPAAYAHVAGLLADIFETDVAHARVIEAALGDWDQHLVVTNSDEALGHSSIFATLPGRLTAICEDRIPPLLNTTSQTDYSKLPGFVARAIDLVRFSEPFERLARHLFGKTVIVDSLDTARRMARGDALNHRFVTLAGEVVEADGRVSLGPAASEAGLISRKSELREIHRELAELDDRIASVVDRLNRTEAEISHLELVQQELRTAIYEASTAKVTANAALQNIRETVHRLTQEQPLITGEVTLLEHQINEVLDKAAQGDQSLSALENENKERERLVGAHLERIDAIVARRRESQEELTQAKVAAGQLTEKRAAAAQTINALRRAIHELEQSVASADNDIEQCRGRITDAEQAIAQGQEQLSELARQQKSLESAAARLRDQRDALRLRTDELSQIVKAARQGLSTAETNLHELEMARGTTSVRRDELVVRIVEEMSINLAERYQSYEHAEQDWEQVSAEIAELRGKMERLGNVNLDAISELEELEKRHAFLSGQRDDLTEAHRQLQQLITSLNQESQQRFMAAFDQITEHFRALFRKLFGGGRADIILEDRENVLDCGIEIVAQPPGKELQAISLMSGGEKSMTAIALLMSIFKTRPAPFAILDEVDAALDEANNHRFNRIVEEFVSEAQFIIITHSKRTMNIGDRLYGITMQEPGVSTRVSVQLAQANVA
jgi:chromosome segregation protein